MTLLRWLLLSFALCFGLTACAAPPSPVARARLIADPVEVHADPSAQIVVVHLTNPAPMSRRLANFRIEGGDWLGFQIVNEQLPKTVGSSETVELRVRVDPGAFAIPDPDLVDGQTGYARFRHGHAKLMFDVDGEPREVGLAFDGGPRPFRPWISLLAILTLAGVGLGIWATGDRPGLGFSTTTHGRGPQTATLLTVVGAAALLAVAFALPVARPWCPHPWPRGTLTHAQCLDGRGGAVLQVWPGSLDLASAWIVLAAGIACLVSGAGSPTRTIAHATPRVVILMMTSVALAIEASHFDIAALAWPIDGVSGDGAVQLRWRAMQHPLAALACLWALGTLFPGPRPGRLSSAASGDPDETTVPGRWWIDFVATLLVTVLWFSGPIVGTAMDGSMTGVALSAVVFAVSAIGVHAVARMIRARTDLSAVPPGAWLVVATACTLWIAW